MGVLVNIAKTDSKPLFIDASDITNILVLPEKNEIGIYNSKGLLIHIAHESWNVDVTAVAQKLIDSGVSLQVFPTGYNTNERQQYVSPAAVTYITHSKPANDGKVGIVIGVKGSGQESANAATQAEVDSLVAAVSAQKNLLKYPPEEVYSRWSDAAALYIDPKSVTRITTNSHNQIDVGFEASGSLDIQMKELLNLNKLANELYYNQGDQTTTDLKAIFDEAQRRKDTVEKQAKFKFAHEIAIRHGGLIPVPNPERAVYIQREDIGSISFHEDESERDNKHILYIRPQATSGNPYPQAISLYFKTDADRMATFNLLNDVISAKPVQKNQHKPKI